MRRNNRTKIDYFAAEQLRLARAYRNMPLQKLADQIGCSYQQIAKYENAENRMTLGVLAKLSDALDISIVCFFPDKYTKKEAPNYMAQSGA